MKIQIQQFFFGFLFSFFIAINVHASDRVALLIANQDYRNGENDLKNPVNDANLLSGKLTSLGFEVKVVTDGDRIAMHQAIDNFSLQARGAESAVFYYSGHGMQNKYNQNFLIPVDANIKDDNSISYSAVNVQKIINKLDEANPKVSLVMLDACRNNKFLGTRGSKNFAVIPYKTESDGEMLVSYATKTGEVAIDGKGKNSPYAIAVGQQLESASSTPLELIFHNVKEKVKQHTNNNQSPTTEGDVGYYTTLIPQQHSNQAPINENEPTKVTDISDTVLVGYKTNNKYGFKNSRTGKIVIPAQYDFVRKFSEDLAHVTKNGKSGFINRQGNLVIDFQYNLASQFSEGLVSVNKNHKNGFIDKKGNIVIPFKYDFAGSFSEGLAGVKKDRKWGFINKKGQTIIELQYDNAWSFYEGIAGVKKNRKWGFINKKGNIVIDFIYDEIGIFSEGLIPVKKNEKWGFIDKTGNQIIPFEYDTASSFSKGKALVGKDNKFYYINQENKWIKDFIWE